MKVAIAKGQGELVIAEVPIPEPGDYQCLCQILACATCTGTDQKIVAGTLPWSETYPGILGHESVGRVVKTGRMVRYVKEGDVYLRPTAVYHREKLGGYTSLWGGFAEYGLITDLQSLREDRPDVPYNNYCIYQQKIPSDIAVSPADATMLITLKEVSSSVANAGVRFRSSIVILGSGTVALGMCLFAKFYGAGPIIVVGRRDEPLSRFRPMGADFTINNLDEDPVTRTKEITSGRGVDFVLDTTGDSEVLLEAGRLLAPGGKLVPYATGHSFKYQVDRSRGPAQWNVFFTGPSEELAHEYVIGLLRMKLLTPSVFFSHRLPFTQIVEGFGLLKQKQASKIVFEMDGGSGNRK